MDTDTIVSNAVRCGQAYQRGYYRGCDDECGGFYNHEPLSGEWAGESIPELLGDLIQDWFNECGPDRENYGTTAEYMRAHQDALDVIVAELCDHYEQGYAAAFADRSFCDVCGDLCDPKYLIRDNDVAYCGPACSGDLGG